MIVTSLIWGLCCLAHYYFRTAAFLRGPHEGDLYAFSWGFQAFNFAVYPFPVWLMALGVALYCEREYFNQKQ